MGRFDEGIEELNSQAANPAAPAGMQQMASAGSSYLGNDQQTPPGTSMLGAWLTENSYVEGASHWYSGANREGTNQGWDSTWTDTFQEQWQDSAEKGTLREYFASDNAPTGVVTWDHTTDDGIAHEFGDVYENGKLIGNLYKDFDRPTADLMMTPWLLDDDTQAQVFSSSDRTERLTREIDNAREDRNANFENALKAMEVQGEIDATAQDIGEGGSEVAVVGGGVAGGAALGAGIGAIGGPVGAGGGAVIGGVVGGVTSYLNRDSLSQQAARAYVTTGMATEENGTLAGITTGVAQWSGYAMKTTTPTSNLTQGLYDWYAGDVGDGKSEFYRTDEQGRNAAPTLVRVADVAATVGDSLLQFASPIGVAVYSAQMTGVVGGEVAALSANRGEVMDYRQGGFNNIFTDENGDTDWSSAAAGIGKIAIDAVQLGMARGLAGATNAARAQAGESAAYGAGSVSSRVGAARGAVSSRLPLWMGGTRGVADDATRVYASGFKMTQGADGAIVAGSRRPTLALLAPSEQLSALSARYIGMRQIARTNGAVSADDFYRAARAMSAGDKKLTNALVNGLGEGYEEAVQAVLEPHSMGHSATAEEIYMAAAYGAASGLGMASGFNLRTPNANDQLFSMAQVGHFMRTGGEYLDRATFDGWTQVEKQKHASLASLQKEVAEAAFRRIHEDQALEMDAGVVGAAKLEDAIQSQLASNLARATSRTDGSFTIVQHEFTPRLDADGNLEFGQLPIDAAAASALQTVRNIHNHGRGLVIGYQRLAKRTAEVRAAVEANPVDVDLQGELTTAERQEMLAELSVVWNQRVLQALDVHLDRIGDPNATPAEVQAEVEVFNDLLQRMFNGTVADFEGNPLTEDDVLALQRAVSLVFGRDPFDQSGSIQILVPQASAALTMTNSHNLVEVNHAILPAIRGDYDGDKIRQQAQLVFGESQFAAARAGQHFLGAGASVNVGAPKQEKYNVEGMAKALVSNNVTLASFADQVLASISTSVRKRYAGAIERPVLDAVLTRFSDAVRANDKDARAALLDGLAAEAGGEITKFAMENSSNEWLWLDGLIVSNFQRFQEAQAAHRPAAVPDSTTVAVNQQSPEVRERRALEAAEVGMTLGLWAPGDSMFRKSQMLHYSSVNAAVLSAQDAQRLPLSEQALFYRQLNQMVSRSELDNLLAKDSITAGVLAQLQILAADAQDLNPKLSRGQALAVIANMAVEDFDIDVDGTLLESSAKREISLTQALLKQALAEDRRLNAKIFDASPELQAKHRRLEKMTRPRSSSTASGSTYGAEAAFVEVVGAQQLFALLGDDANIFGPHLTVEQFVREYVNKHETERFAMTRALHDEPMYLGQSRKKGMPYHLDEALEEGSEISAYRAVVDAILSVGNHRISIDEGKLHGEIAERSNDTSEDFRQSHTQVRAALMEYAGMSPREDGELTVEIIQRMFTEHPDVQRAIFNMIPNVSANAVIEKRDGGSVVANWFYTMFTISDPAAAEMHYWRNLLIAEWNAMGQQALVSDEGDEGEAARAFDRLPRRMHRVLYMLNPIHQGDGGLKLQQFLDKLESEDSLESFIEWVNTEPGIRGNQAPFTAWVDDVAEFDADKAQGGWTTALAGAELREALRTVRQRTENLAAGMVEERLSMKNDARTRAAIRRVRKKDRGEDVTLDPNDRDLHDRYVKSLELAGERMVSVGPQVMMTSTIGAVLGFNDHSHTKGIAASNVVADGAFEAQRDAIDYVTNYERLMGSMTAYNLGAVGNNLAQVAKDGGRTMDDWGRAVEWTMPDPDEFLDLLDNPETRPYARGVLFPQVMERDMNGQLRPQFLVGKSLTDLLTGTSFKNLFPRNGKLSQDAAFRYLSMIEGTARKYGDQFAVRKAANDVAIARTSALDHVSDLYEAESMVTTAYYELALVLQTAGALASMPADPGTDPMGDMLKKVKEAHRKHRTAQAIGLEVSELDMIDPALDSMVTAREEEALAEKERLLQRITEDPASEARWLKEIEKVDDQVDRFKQRIEMLRSDDYTAQAVQMFLITGDASLWPDKKKKLLQYIYTHPTLIERSSTSKITINKLTQQMLDPAYAGQPVLEDSEWNELSRAVISLYLEEATTSGAGTSVAPFPNVEQAEDQKYYDTTFGYLIDELLRPNSPLVLAARDLHRLSGRTVADGKVTVDELSFLLSTTVLDTKRLGPWTPDIPRASGEANSRLRSSAAGAAISIPGNVPKRLAAITAATRRTFAKPEEALLSRVSLGWVHLDPKMDPFQEVGVELPGIGAQPRPLAQLNNRFARNVTMTYLDREGTLQNVDLLAESKQLGRAWHHDPSVRDSGYVTVNLERIHRAVDQVTRARGIDPSGVTVEMDFFHPDSQPETVEGGPNWYHNVYFEGTSFKLDADHFESLLSTLWYAHGSISPAMQAAALDAGKLGLAALQVIETLPSAQREAIEADWKTDLAKVLREKARLLVETDLGFGELDIEFFNAAYKDMKLRHFVRGADVDGNLVVWTAEQVVAFQQANPGAPLPFEEASLWVPSDQVLRSMLGEQGTQGVPRLFPDQLEINPARVPVFRGITERMKEQFREGLSGQTLALHETEVVNRARQTQLTVRTATDRKVKAAFDEKMSFFQELKTAIFGDRAEAQRSEDFGFHAGRNLAMVVSRAEKLLTAENLSIHWARMGVPFGPRNPEDSLLSKMALREVAAVKQADGTRAGFIYREGSHAQPAQGLLSQQSLGGDDRPAYRVAPGDLVLVELDSFAGDLELAKKRIDWLAGRGAVVILAAQSSETDMRAELAEHLVDKAQYSPLPGSKHVYQPGEFGSRFQNQKARASTLTEMRGISKRNRVALLTVRGLPIQEGTGWVNHTDERLGGIGVTANLVPSSAMAGFNIPVEQFTDVSQIEYVRNHIRDLNSVEGRTILKDQANGHIKEQDKRAQADLEFDRHFDEMLARFDQHPGTVLPQPGDAFGKGAMIPLVDRQGRVLLYRHGYKALPRYKVNRLTAWKREDGEAVNIAVFPTKPEPQATIHDGEVVEFKWRAGFGLQVELNVPLQVFGDKKLLELLGMKYILGPMPDDVVLPEHGFFPDWSPNIVSDQDTLLSKEATGDMVDNFRMAFAVFGVNFLPDVAEFFFPGRGTTATAQVATREILRAVATRTDPIPLATADEIIKSARLGEAFAELLPGDLLSGVEGVDLGWTERLDDSSSVQAQITAAMLVYLMVPGTRPSDVLESGGFNDNSQGMDGQSVLMPRLFTQLFDLAPFGSPLRLEMMRRVNEQLYNPNADGTGYSMDQDFTFNVLNSDPTKNLKAMLSFPETHSAGDNPVKNGMSFDEDEKAAVSQHSAAIVYGATGAETVYEYDLAKAQAFASGDDIVRFEKDKLDGGAWRMLTDIPKSDKTFQPWRTLTGAENEYMDLARDAKHTFRHELGQEEWSEKERKDYKDLSRTILIRLGLRGDQTQLVDFWIRQTLGRFHGENEQGRDEGAIYGKAAVMAARDVLDNIDDGYLPTLGAEVPSFHLHDLQAIFRANKNRPGKWAPKLGMDTEKRAETWDDWVKVSLGSAITTDTLFDPIYRLAVDGFMHDYQHATDSLMSMPVSIDVLKTMELLDPDLDRMLMSISDPVNASLMEPELIGSIRTSIDDVIGGKRVEGKYRGKAAPASAVAKRRDARRKWRKENGVPVPVDVTMKNFRKNGIETIESGNRTNTAVRILTNLRVGTALINPVLWMSMGPEQWMRAGLDRAANLLTGQATTGATAGAMSRVSQALQGTGTGKVLGELGFQYRYTPEQIGKFNRLYDELGGRPDFKQMVYKDLNFLHLVDPATGRFERGTAAYARFGARMQDPTWGMSAKSLAHRYLEAALQHMQMTPTLNAVSTDKLVSEMMTDPTYLEKHFPSAHQAGMHSIAQIRSLKETTASQFLRGFIDPMAKSNNLAINLFGNLVFKIPMLFSGYAMNVATTITGLQGLDQIVAMGLDGRKKGPGSFLGRIQAKIRGDEFDPQTDATFDMSSVLEGVDLSRAFIRGGLTHTGLFTLGMMAGGLGLSGEDDEMKKRRLLSQAQGVGMVYDPRKVEADFRNADAIYMDALPFGIGSLFEPDEGTGRSPVQMHWMLKQFVSPLMGMEKFFETGDFRHVTWGFEDALGSFPLINTMMWNEATVTAQKLLGMAHEEDLTTEDGLVKQAGWLTQAVGSYERMLFENSFVNQLYIGYDRYDRDPYVMAQRDSDGELQRDIENNAYKQNLALQTFIDPKTGKPTRGYQSRDDASAARHVLSENRATFAFVASMFTGGVGESDYWRYNMPYKVRTIEKEPVTFEEAKANFLAAFRGANLGADFDNFTDLELEQVIRVEMAKSLGYFPPDDAVLPVAGREAAKYGEVSTETGQAYLSKIDEYGSEVLTDDGARGVFWGLYKGSVQFGHESLSNLHVPYEMRERVQQSISDDLMAEGLRMGLDKSKATERVERIFGGYGEGQTGLAEIIWASEEKLSYSAKQKYVQLNTTYVMGPDGRPWATGFGRDKLLSALGIPPWKRMIQPEHGALDLDSRGNVVNLLTQQNTGLRAIEPLDETRYVPTDVEIGESIRKAIEESSAKSGSFAPFKPFKSEDGGGSGWQDWGNGWRNYGGYGGYGGGGGSAYFNRMYSLPDQIAPYGNSMAFINSSNPIIRRATIRRERVSSDRGRLNQWQ